VQKKVTMGGRKIKMYTAHMGYILCNIFRHSMHKEHKMNAYLGGLSHSPHFSSPKQILMKSGIQGLQ